MSPVPSARSEITPFYVMEMMRAAAEREARGGEVLHLEVGQPSTSAPALALAAAHTALDAEPLGYTGAGGLPELRARIGRWYQERYGVAVNAERVVVTTGASGSCALAFLALFDVGDRVGLLEPGYPCYRNDLQALGVATVPVPVGHDTAFRPSIDQLDAALPLDGLIVASPSNPTGTILSSNDLAAIAAWAKRNNVTLIVDEIYHGIDYGDTPAETALKHSDDVVVVNSFSKYFSMTGWRLGWLIAPPRIALAVERLAQSFTIAAPTLSQRAALAAFDAVDELDANVARYRQNRTVILDGLRAAGLGRMAPPDGAFFVWVDVTDLCQRLETTSQTLCTQWLDELGIAATPGIDFDAVAGDRFVRFSYAGATDELTEAMRRLADWTKATYPTMRS